MPVQFQVTAYLLPQDDASARSAYLGLLQAAEEAWLIGDAHGLADILPVLANRSAGPPVHVFLDDLADSTDQTLLHTLVDEKRVDITIGRDQVLEIQGAATAGGSAFISTGPLAFLLSHIDVALRLRREYVELGRAAWTDEPGAQILASPPPELRPLPSVEGSVTILTTDEHGNLVPQPPAPAAVPTHEASPAPPAPQAPSSSGSTTPPAPLTPEDTGTPTCPAAPAEGSPAA